MVSNLEPLQILEYGSFELTYASSDTGCPCDSLPIISMFATSTCWNGALLRHPELHKTPHSPLCWPQGTFQALLLSVHSTHRCVRDPRRTIPMGRGWDSRCWYRQQALWNRSNDGWQQVSYFHYDTWKKQLRKLSQTLTSLLKRKYYWSETKLQEQKPQAGFVTDWASTLASQLARDCRSPGTLWGQQRHLVAQRT